MEINLSKTLLAPLRESRFRNLQKFCLWHPQHPGLWNLQSHYGLESKIQDPMTKTGILCLESGIQDPCMGYRCYEPVTCTRGCSYLFLLLIELYCCLYLDVMLYNRWNLLVPSNVCPRPELLRYWT